MVYRAIGLMSGSSLDGLDIAFVEFHENGGKWSYDIQYADCYPYSSEWADRLRSAISLSALDYQLLHTDYGRYLGEQVNAFIIANELQYRVALIGSHGHTTFHLPSKGMTAQLGDGAALAAETSLPVVTDLRAMDVALGGQGAPIVPIGERLLLTEFKWFLNLGGIANISHNGETYSAFDVCPANRVLNSLAAEIGMEYDDGGRNAASGSVDQVLLAELNALAYYSEKSPKSLANDFGTDTVYPLIQKAGLSVPDALRTYTQHIIEQIILGVTQVRGDGSGAIGKQKMLVTGGGAFNTTLIELLRGELDQLSIELIIPSDKLIQYKEAMIMALIGVLRWREEVNVFSSVTGAKRDSVGGAMWLAEQGL